MQSKSNIVKILHKFTKYFIVSGGFFLLYMLLIRVLTDKIGIHYLVSAIIAFTITAIGGFLFQKYITFKNNDKKHMKQMGFFMLFLVTGLGFDLLILKIGVDYFNFFYMYVAVFSKGCTFLWNFIMNYLFTFNQ